MLSFGVSNLRRLKLVPPITLKPITLLVGRNSSGKSSFLRTFPLLRQSLMTRTSSPILWYGDLVDFGSFDNAVTDQVSGEPISFSFAIDRLGTQDDGRRYAYFPRNMAFTGISRTGVSLDVSIVNVGDRARLSRVFVRVKEPELQFEILIGDNSKITSIRVNQKEVLDAVKPLTLELTPGTILPELTLVSIVTETVRRSRHHRYFIDDDGNEFWKLILELLKPHLKKISDDWLYRTAAELISIQPFTKKAVRDRLARHGPQTLRKFIAEICSKDRHGIFPKLQDISMVATLPPVLSQIRSYLREIITSTLYIGPARARSERYYRYQDLAVSEIDPDGKNFPMFLNSLTSFQISQLSRWIEELFDYGLSVSRQQGGGHMSITLTSHGFSSNIVDTGYGVSQILPVLGQIWWARNRPRTLGRPPGTFFSLLAIEQPELHLHPAHQALLADALVGEVNSAGTEGPGRPDPIHFLIETHSETLLNRLGELVAKGKLNHDDIQVVIFDALDDDSRLTDVTTSSFNENGELINWPYGFFQPTAR
jgi:hypothetical protein